MDGSKSRRGRRRSGRVSGPAPLRAGRGSHQTLMQLRLQTRGGQRHRQRWPLGGEVAAIGVPRCGAPAALMNVTGWIACGWWSADAVTSTY